MSDQTKSAPWAWLDGAIRRTTIHVGSKNYAEMKIEDFERFVTTIDLLREALEEISATDIDSVSGQSASIADAALDIASRGDV